MIKVLLIICILLFTSTYISLNKNIKIFEKVSYAADKEAVNRPKTLREAGQKYDVARLLARHLKEIEEERNRPVYVVQAETEEELGYAAIKKLNPAISPEKPVLIKPNLGGFVRIRKGKDNGVTGRTTSPLFVKGIIKYLKEKGVRDIAVGESWGVTKPEEVKNLFRISGYEKLAKETGVNLLDLNYYNDGKGLTKPVKIPYPGAELLKDDLYLPEIYLKYLTGGVVINVPKMKTHRFSITSLSLKNLMGVLFMKGPSEYMQANKHLMHREITKWFGRKNNLTKDKLKEYTISYRLFSKRLLDLYAAAKPDFTIIEGYYGTEGDGFDKIELRKEKIAFASYNQIYADYAATEYMGFIASKDLKTRFNFDRPVYLTESFERFYGNIDAKKDIRINKPEGLSYNKKPYNLIPMLGK